MLGSHRPLQANFEIENNTQWVHLSAEKSLRTRRDRKLLVRCISFLWKTTVWTAKIMISCHVVFYLNNKKLLRVASEQKLLKIFVLSIYIQYKFADDFVVILMWLQNYFSHMRFCGFMCVALDGKKVSFFFFLTDIHAFVYHKHCRAWGLYGSIFILYLCIFGPFFSRLWSAFFFQLCHLTEYCNRGSRIKNFVTL